MDLVSGLDQGQNTYVPAVSAMTLAFTSLRNLEPLRARLVASRKLADLQEDLADAGDCVLAFGYYQFSGAQFTNLYAFTKKAIYWYDAQNEQFDPEPIYTYSTEASIPPITLPWVDCLYVYRIDQRPIRIEYKKVTVLPAEVPRARYGIMFNSHVFLANIGTNSGRHYNRIQWSDLDAPESFVINPLNSEADLFELESGHAEITGLSLQRGNGLIYTSNSIWVASYVGFPGSFTFSPLFNGIGNILHHAVVRNKEVDFFIGPDNFYLLNGFQLVAIGNPIWNEFIDDVLIEVDAVAFGYLDSRRDQVFWVYARKTGGRRVVLYNYKEEKWAFRDADEMSAFFDTPRLQFRGYQVIDDYSETFDSEPDLYPDDPALYFPYSLPQLIGSFDSRSVRRFSADKHEKLSFETFDIYFNNIEQVKEIDRVTIDYKGEGNPSVHLQIGTRARQSLDIEWSDEIAGSIIDGSLSFFVRSAAVGKFIRFRLLITNSHEDQVDELLLWSASLVTTQNDDAAK